MSSSSGGMLVLISIISSTSSVSALTSLFSGFLAASLKETPHEEQKFGVNVKEKIRSIKENIDVLTLTATPIPRTLQYSLMSARDL